MWLIFLLLALVHVNFGFILDGQPRPLKVATFNIQVFGISKYSHDEVVQTIIKIISRYDVIVIQEIRDASDTSFEHLRQDLNTYIKAHGHNYAYAKIESTRLGRTHSKEQYGFLYRTDVLTSSGTYQFPDPRDVFEREPFGVKFHSPTTVVSDFVLVANHIKPSMAMEELDNLTAVYDIYKSHFHTSNVILAGDFNADCHYLTHPNWQYVSLRQESRFFWLVDDNADTTVADTDCSYDRFVVGSTQMHDAIVPGSVKVYRFDEAMGISKSEGLAVSDHYPVELQITGKNSR